jgi:dihydroorotase
MSRLTRRELLRNGVQLAALAPLDAWAAMGANDKFDLLVRNGNLLDPGASLSGRRDIGIRHGRVVRRHAQQPP